MFGSPSIDKSAMAFAGLSFAARYRDVKIVSEFINSKSFADNDNFAKAIKNLTKLFGFDAVNLNIPVLWVRFPSTRREHIRQRALLVRPPRLTVCAIEMILSGTRTLL